MRKTLAYLILISLLGCLAYSCKTRKKDCKGRRKTTKTEMGGWL
ncbi:MAG TPA: hypothetical protein PLU73_06340 [Bacteroidia bacterium]|nr:hypothetical protein [Bacteroidia bacterium]